MAKYPAAYFDGASDPDKYVHANGGGVQFNTDANNNTVLVGAGGVNYAALPLDANGNVIANVALRKDTLANLLLVADAGHGEIAVATDTDMLVRYLGSPSVGTAFGRTTEVGWLFLVGQFTTIATGVDTKLGFGLSASTSAYLSGLFDDANDWFTTPPASFASHIEIFTNCQPSTAGGTYREITLQYDSSAGGDGSAWTDIVRTPYLASASVNVRTKDTIFVTNGNPGKKHRIVLKHDNASSLFFVSHGARVTFHNAT